MPKFGSSSTQILLLVSASIHTYVLVQAEVAHDQTSRFVFRSRCKAIDWAALQSVSTSSVVR